MAGHDGRGFLRIGVLAEKTGTTTDTVRYYERLGLLRTPERSANGYRRYGAEDVGRMQFIRRAQRLGLSLEEIRGLLGLAQEGECQPLRRQVTVLLARKIEECERQLAELAAFKQSLEERHRLTIERLKEPACGCAAFPATCGCLPVRFSEPRAFSPDGSSERRST